MLFAKLKENHMVAEFVLEQARLKIAENRMKTGNSYLTPEDQKEIFNNQIKTESVMAYKSSAIIVSDSSPLNNLLYIENWKNDHYRLGETMRFLQENQPLVFLCLPIDSSMKLTDMNRIHSLEESLKLHEKFTEINEFFNVKPVLVYGTPEERLKTSLETVYNKVYQG